MANKYALIIGIENYPEESGQNKVSYALNDCKAIADYFEKDAGFQVERPIFDEEATYSGMIRALDRFFHYIEPDDWAALFYAGHGHYTEHGGYLVPYSYKKGEEFNEANCLSFDSINKRLQAKKPDKVLILLDTCHAGSALEQVGLRKSADPSAEPREIVLAAPKIEKQWEDMVRKKEKSRSSARIIFTSCSPVETSLSEDKFSHGLFTHFLLQGFSGACCPGKNEVNIEELIPWTKTKVIEFCKEKSRNENRNFNQTPCAKMHITTDFRLPIRKTGAREKPAHLPDMTQAFADAEAHLKENRFDDARAVLKNILEQDPLNWEALKKLQTVGEAEESHEQKLQEEFKKTFEEWLKRGDGFLKEGKIREAEECFDHAEKIFPADDRLEGYREQIEAKKNLKGETLLEQLKGLFQKADALKEQGKYAQVLQLYNHILTIHPKNARIPRERSDVLNRYKEMKLKQFLDLKISGVEQWLKQRQEWLGETEQMHEEYLFVGMEEESIELKERIHKISKEIQEQESQLQSLKRFQNKEASAENLDKQGIIDIFLKSHLEQIKADPFLKEAFFSGIVKTQPAPKSSVQILKKDGRFMAYNDGTVLDTQTNLMWAAKDNGKDINCHDAKAYCENFRGGGYSDWIMPTSGELANLYDNNNKCIATELIQLSTGWVWSSDKSGGSAGYFYFAYGKRHWTPPSSDGNLRALPVRASK